VGLGHINTPSQPAPAGKRKRGDRNVRVPHKHCNYTHSLPNARSCNLIKKYRRIIKEKGVNKGATHIEMAWRPHPVWSNGDVPTQTSFGIRHSAVPAIPTAGSSFPGTYFLAISRDGNDGALDVPQHRSASYVETPPVILGGL